MSSEYGYYWEMVMSQAYIHGSVSLTLPTVNNIREANFVIVSTTPETEIIHTALDLQKTVFTLIPTTIRHRRVIYCTDEKMLAEELRKYGFCDPEEVGVLVVGLNPDGTGGAEISMRILVREMELRGYNVHYVGVNEIRRYRPKVLFAQSCIGSTVQDLPYKKIVYVQDVQWKFDPSKFDWVFANSIFTADKFRAYAKLYPPLNPEWIRPRRSKVYVLCMDYAKGGEILREVAKRLPEYQFMVVDRGRQATKIEGNFILTHYTPNPADLYENAGVVVVPSNVPEAFGRVVIEALACGIPVAVSTQGNLPEFARLSDRVRVCETVEDYVNAIKEMWEWDTVPEHLPIPGDWKLFDYVMYKCGVKPDDTPICVSMNAGLGDAVMAVPTLHGLLRHRDVVVSKDTPTHIKELWCMALRIKEADRKPDIFLQPYRDLPLIEILNRPRPCEIMAQVGVDGYFVNPRVPIPPFYEGEARKWLGEYKRPLILFCYKAGNKYRSMPIKHASLIRKELERTFPEADIRYIGHNKSRCESIYQLCAVLKYADVVISVDTGIAHLTGALGGANKLVVIQGATYNSAMIDYKYLYGVKHILTVPCKKQPCWDKTKVGCTQAYCLQVDPQQVVRAVKEILNDRDNDSGEVRLLS